MNKVCPICGKEYDEYYESARSMTRNKEEICMNCGRTQLKTASEISLSPTYSTSLIHNWMNDDERASKFVTKCLKRHRRFDWGEMDEEDLTANDKAIYTGDRLFSSYNIPKEIRHGMGVKIWIITEADRSATTILFPSEY